MIKYITQLYKKSQPPIQKLSKITPENLDEYIVQQPHVDSFAIMHRRKSLSSSGINRPKRINTLSLLQNIFTFQRKNILLTEPEQHAIQKIIKKAPRLFDEIDNTITTITRKGRVELHDIPQIVYIVFHVLQRNKYITSENSLNIIKFVVDTILDSITYPLSLLENDIVAKQTVLNNSFALLTAKLPEPEYKWGIGWELWFHDDKSLTTFG